MPDEHHSPGAIASNMTCQMKRDLPLNSDKPPSIWWRAHTQQVVSNFTSKLTRCPLYQSAIFGRLRRLPYDSTVPLRGDYNIAENPLPLCEGMLLFQPTVSVSASVFDG